MIEPRRQIRPDIDASALLQFFERCQRQVTQMQGMLVEQSPFIDARSLRRMTQLSREIAVGAELASLTTLARAADQVEWLATDVLGHPATGPIGFTARMGERLGVLDVQLRMASLSND